MDISKGSDFRDYDTYNNIPVPFTRDGENRFEYLITKIECIQAVKHVDSWTRNDSFHPTSNLGVFL